MAVAEQTLVVAARLALQQVGAGRDRATRRVVQQRGERRVPAHRLAGPAAEGAHALIVAGALGSAELLVHQPFDVGVGRRCRADRLAARIPSPHLSGGIRWRGLTLRFGFAKDSG